MGNACRRAIARVSVCERLSSSTNSATSSVISANNALRCSIVILRSAITAPSRILMLTSWSLQSTPAELSIASLLIRPPLSANSMRPRWVRPRLPPSPTIRHRRLLPLTRNPSLARSPTSALDSVDALTYVPTPPFQNTSTGACRIVEISSLGVKAVRSVPNRLRASALSVMVFRVRGKIPPPGDSSDTS